MQTICSFMTTPKTEEDTGSLLVLLPANWSRQHKVRLTG